ncbi:XkdQ/YqbQ family protein, partial [Acutalibacter muris]|uniref:XkdQ/YqbQ family protein n=1 Tax=Acutalibacter muris TaxID=1796620 RepID=UPI00272CFE51
GLESKIGMRQEVDEPDDTLSQAQLNALVKSMLAEKSRPKESLSVSAVGQADVISGIGVFIRIPHLNLSKTYYVERDDHSFEGEYHSMSLSLVSAADIDG